MPDRRPNKRRPIIERLMRRTSRRPNGCLEWTGYRNPVNGYGRMNVDYMPRYVHRVAWELANGPIPDGMVIMHRCDNPPCVELSHLVLGTQKENIADKYAKGRARVAVGERCGKSTLTTEQVIEMRRLYAQGVPKAELAIRFSVSRPNVYVVVTRRTWKHIPPQAADSVV